MADENDFEAIPTQSSSQIEQVYFNSASSQGRILFMKNGSLYEYDNATKDEADQIANGAIAGSVGITFGQLWKNIKPFRRIR